MAGNDIKVMVALSGGVDSALAAALLVEEGRHVTGITFRTHCYARDEMKEERSRRVPCCSLSAIEDARRICARLGIRHQVVDVAREFEEKVVGPFCREYLHGRTPNPCVSCNRHIKFGRLLGLARVLGASYLATGHYARVLHARGRGRHRLKRGRDRVKDQSYVLWPLGQEELGGVLFPLGELTKDEVRAEAASRGLPVAEREASQEICFVPRDYRDYLRRRLAASEEARSAPGFAPGPLLDERGRVVGSHEGVANYTLGQRKGLPALGDGPRYVVALVPERHEVHLGREEDLGRRRVSARDLNLVGLAEWPDRLRARVQIRSRHQAAPATVRREGEDELEVLFDEAQRSPTPGQSAVFYDGDEVLGGGLLERVRAGS